MKMKPHVRNAYKMVKSKLRTWWQSKRKYLRCVMNLTHKYYCSECREYVFAVTPTLLATRLNYHNAVKHPLDFANWTAATVILSAQYSDSVDAPPAYLTKNSELWGNAKNPPTITDEDRVFLAGGGVAWD